MKMVQDGDDINHAGKELNFSLIPVTETTGVRGSSDGWKHTPFRCPGVMSAITSAKPKYE